MFQFPNLKNFYFEAMLAKLPTIIRKCGGSQEIVIAGETGIMLSGNNTQSLANAFERFYLKNLGIMGNNGFKRAQKLFTYPRFTHEVSNVLTKMLYFDNEDPIYTCSSAIKNGKGEILEEKSSESSPPIPALPR